MSVFTSCGTKKTEQPAKESEENASDNNATEAEKTNEKKTLKYATWNVNEGATNPMFEKIAEEYYKKNENAVIEYIGIPFGEIKQQTFVMAASGDAPDIIQTYTSWFSSYAASDIIVPVDDLMGEDFINDLYESIRQDYTYNSKLMGIPFITSPYILYWNKELFKKAGLDPEKPPVTYDEMLSMAEKIATLKDDEGNKIYGLGEVTDKLSINGMIALRNIYSFGGSLYDANGNVNLNTPQVVETLEYYKALIDKGLSPEAAKLKDFRNLFSIGRLGMYMDGFYAKAVFRNLSGKGEEFDKEWGAALVPMNKTGKSVSIADSHGLVITKDCNDKDLAADFIKHLTSKEVIAMYHKSNNVLSARASVNKDPEINDCEYAATCLEQLENFVHPLPKNHPAMEQVYLELATALQEVVVAKKDPAKAAEDLDTKLKGLLK
jgi:multiple sugar transport system substrate-binding protein